MLRLLYSDLENIETVACAVLVSALQELLIRTSRRWQRYQYYVRIRKLTHAEAATRVLDVFRNDHETESVIAETFVELFVLSLAPIMYVAFWRHRLVINFGYSTTHPLDVQLLLCSWLLQLVAELAIDTVCFSIESVSGGLTPHEVWESIPRWTWFFGVTVCVLMVYSNVMPAFAKFPSGGCVSEGLPTICSCAQSCYLGLHADMPMQHKLCENLLNIVHRLHGNLTTLEDGSVVPPAVAAALARHADPRLGGWRCLAATGSEMVLNGTSLTFSDE